MMTTPAFRGVYEVTVPTPLVLRRNSETTTTSAFGRPRISVPPVDCGARPRVATFTKTVLLASHSVVPTFYFHLQSSVDFSYTRVF